MSARHAGHRQCEDQDRSMARNRSPSTGSQFAGDPGWFMFKIDGSSELLVDDPERERSLLGLVRVVADRCGPAYGEISLDAYRQAGFDSLLERALALDSSETVLRSRHVLRGYSWLTIVPQEIGDRLGGLARLRASGAFVEVAAPGSWRVLATGHREVRRLHPGPDGGGLRGPRVGAAPGAPLW